MSRLDGKVALVTGGRAGIGQAIARRLHDEGARIFTAQRGDDPEFEAITADFNDTDTAETVVDVVSARAGRLDILVNNAGLMEEATVEEIPLSAWERTLRVNLTAPFLLIKHALPLLKVQGGSIVNIGSVEGISANPQHAAYCASKAGLHGLTRAVAVDSGAFGVRCNAIAPGWIDTALNVEFIEAQAAPDQFRRDLHRIHPVGRVGQPEDIAALTAFLVSDDARFITGQTYTADGGRMAKLSLP